MDLVALSQDFAVPFFILLIALLIALLKGQTTKRPEPRQPLQRIPSKLLFEDSPAATTLHLSLQETPIETTSSPIKKRPRCTKEMIVAQVILERPHAFKGRAF